MKNKRKRGRKQKRKTWRNTLLREKSCQSQAKIMKNKKLGV